ncbi:rhodanese-like domain-containing protein [Fulvivirga sp. M361]|uniref:rhodanese-like domain-containing protein n=1 Tax=Fulvivirga sp. M361 TaxID=2594266 RepID=UPI00117B6F9D|nr:rhodanese-like domain-containing protein [Fulvivirga sp. M361]TRX54866.1 rhodanese-like domain-containing protein [Fulvivirga sp. M361]
MNTRLTLSTIILALGTVAAMLPGKENDSVMLNERQVLQEMLLDANYFSVDELAHLLISGDPSIQLIDIRPAADFKEPIRGAINVPFDSIFTDNFAYLFDQGVMKNILYSDDDHTAAQLWMITTQLGYQNNYLLKGGLTEWKSSILDPKYPESTAPKEAFDLYQRRAAASQYFTGARALPPTDLFKPLSPIKRKKKKKVEGGCS